MSDACRSEEATNGGEESGVFPTPRASVIAAALEAHRGEPAGDPTHGGLPLSRYVAVGALLRSFSRAEKPAVLAALGLDLATWDAAHATWLETLRRSEEAGTGLLARWSRDFDAAWEDLQAAPPTLADLEAARAPSVGRPATSMQPNTLPSAARHGSAQAGGPSKTLASVAIAPAFAHRAPAHLVGTMPSAAGASTPSTPPAASMSSTPSRPPRSPSKTPLPGATMTLEQYASLWVELETWPAARGAILARYGLSGEAAFADLSAWWSGHLVFDADLAARWTAARRTYAQWLAGVAAKRQAGC